MADNPFDTAYGTTGKNPFDEVYAEKRPGLLDRAWRAAKGSVAETAETALKLPFAAAPILPESAKQGLLHGVERLEEYRKGIEAPPPQTIPERLATAGGGLAPYLAGGALGAAGRGLNAASRAARVMKGVGKASEAAMLANPWMEGMQRGMDAGESPERAWLSGGAGTAATAAMMHMPMKTGKQALGSAFGIPAIGAAERALQNQITTKPELQQQVFDPQAMLTDFILGMGFSSLAHWGNVRSSNRYVDYVARKIEAGHPPTAEESARVQQIAQGGVGKAAQARAKGIIDRGLQYQEPMAESEATPPYQPPAGDYFAEDSDGFAGPEMQKAAKVQEALNAKAMKAKAAREARWDKNNPPILVGEPNPYGDPEAVVDAYTHARGLPKQDTIPEPPLAPRVGLEPDFMEGQAPLDFVMGEGGELQTPHPYIPDFTRPRVSAYPRQPDITPRRPTPQRPLLEAPDNWSSLDDRPNGGTPVGGPGIEFYRGPEEYRQSPGDYIENGAQSHLGEGPQETRGLSPDTTFYRGPEEYAQYPWDYRAEAPIPKTEQGGSNGKRRNADEGNGGNDAASDAQRGLAQGLPAQEEGKGIPPAQEKVAVKEAPVQPKAKGLAPEQPVQKDAPYIEEYGNQTAVFIGEGEGKKLLAGPMPWTQAKKWIKDNPPQPVLPEPVPAPKAKKAKGPAPNPQEVVAAIQQDRNEILAAQGSKPTTVKEDAAFINSQIEKMNKPKGITPPAEPPKKEAQAAEEVDPETAAWLKNAGIAIENFKAAQGTKKNAHEGPQKPVGAPKAAKPTKGITPETAPVQEAPKLSVTKSAKKAAPPAPEPPVIEAKPVKVQAKEAAPPEDRQPKRYIPGRPDLAKGAEPVAADDAKIEKNIKKVVEKAAKEETKQGKANNLLGKEIPLTIKGDNEHLYEGEVNGVKVKYRVDRMFHETKYEVEGPSGWTTWKTKESAEQAIEKAARKKNPLSNQKGSPDNLINDALESLRTTKGFQAFRESVHNVGRHVYEAGMKFGEFSRRMKDAVGDLWGKVKQHVETVWRTLKSNRGSLTKEGVTNPFYSAPERHVENTKQEKWGTGEEFLRWIGKQQGVTQAEVKNLGLNDLAGEKNVSKKDILDTIKANKVETKDVMLGEPPKLKPFKAASEELQRNHDAFFNGSTDNLSASITSVVDRRTGKLYEARDFEKIPDTEFKQAVLSSLEKAGFTRALDGYIARTKDQTSDSAKYGTYTEPGAKEGSYRELFVTVPKLKEEVPEWTDAQYLEAKKKILAEGVEAGTDEYWARVGALQKEAFGKGRWKDGHGDYDHIDNPIVRIRFNEREVPRQPKGEVFENSDGTYSLIMENGEVAKNRDGAAKRFTDPESAKAYAQPGAAKQRILFVEEMQGPQPHEEAKMPEYLRKRMYDIGVKRILAYAKEKGYDGVAWTTGEMQAKRYSLEQHVDNILYSPYDDGKTFEVTATTKNGEEIRGVAGRKTLAEIAEIFGKDIADRIEKNQGEVADVSQVPSDVDLTDPTRNVYRLSGDNLKMGGEGLKRLYDHDLPAMFKKHGGEAAGKLNDTGAGTGGKGLASWGEIEGGRERLGGVPYMPITQKTPDSYTLYDITSIPSLAFKEAKEMVHNIGQSLYQPGMKFKEFMGAMKEKLGEVWESAKAHLESAWKAVRSERGNVTLRDGERYPEDTRDFNGDFTDYERVAREVHELGKKMAEYDKSLKNHRLKEHTEGSAKIAVKMARILGFSEPEVHEIMYGMWVHDLGKTRLPPEIWDSINGNLTPEQKKIIQSHPREAVKWLKEQGYTLTPRITNIIEHHHEKFDGTGYPDHTFMDSIPIEAQIASAADVWNAITTRGTYAPKMTYDEAVQFMQKQRGLHFSPKIVDALLKAVAPKDASSIGKILGSERGSFSWKPTRDKLMEKSEKPAKDIVKLTDALFYRERGASQETKNEVAKRMGGINRVVDTIELKMKDHLREMQSAPLERKMNFIKAIRDNDISSLNGRDRELAEMQVTMGDHLWDKMVELNPELAKYRKEGHALMTLQWINDASVRDMNGGLWDAASLEGSKRFLKKRSDKSFEEIEGMGKVLKSTNPVEIFMNTAVNQAKYVYTGFMAKQAKSTGRWFYVPDGMAKPDPDVARKIPGAIAEVHKRILFPEAIKGTEYVDKRLYEGLQAVAENMGIDPQRVVSVAKELAKKGIRGEALGYAVTTGETVTQYNTPEAVLAHEIGHQIDNQLQRQYGKDGGLWNEIITKAEGIGKRGKVTKGASRDMRVTLQDEIRAIADIVGHPTKYELNAGPNERLGKYGPGTRPRAYAHTEPEKLAQMIEAYIGAPGMMKDEAPHLYEAFDNWLRTNPNAEQVRGLADLRAGINYKKLGYKVEVPPPQYRKGFNVVDEGGKTVLTFPTRKEAAEYAMKNGYTRTAPNGEEIPNIRGWKPTVAEYAHTGSWYAPTPEVKMLEASLSKDAIRGNEVGKFLLNMKNLWTQVELYSGFHYATIMQEVLSSRFGLALQQTARGDWKELARTANPRNWKSSVALGDLAKEIVRDPDAFEKNNEYLGQLRQFLGEHYTAKLFAERIDEFYNTNGRFIQDKELRFGKLGKRGIDTYYEGKTEGNKWKMVKGVGEMPVDMLYVPLDHLFERLIPNAKFSDWLLQYEYDLKQYATQLKDPKSGITKALLAQRNLRSAENRFGEFNWENLHLDRTYKSALQLLFRSYTWNYGTWRSFGTAGYNVPGQIRELYHAAKEGRQPVIHRDVAWLLTLIATHMLEAGVVAYGAAALQGDKELKPKEWLDWVYPKINRLTRVAPPGYLKEPVMLGKDISHDPFYLPTNYVQSKMQGMFGKLAELYRNKTFYGDQVYDPQAPFEERAADMAKHLIVKPFFAESWRREREDGAGYGALAMNFAGFNKAPGFVDKSAALLLVQKYNSGYVAQKGRAKEAAEDREAKRKVLAHFRKGGSFETLPAEVQTKLEKMSPQRQMNILRETEVTPLQAGFQVLRELPEAIHVWKKMTPQEKLETAAMMEQKVLAYEKREGNNPERIERMMAKVAPILAEIARMDMSKVSDLTSYEDEQAIAKATPPEAPEPVVQDEEENDRELDSRRNATAAFLLSTM